MLLIYCRFHEEVIKLYPPPKNKYIDKYCRRHIRKYYSAYMSKANLGHDLKNGLERKILSNSLL